VNRCATQKQILLAVNGCAIPEQNRLLQELPLWFLLGQGLSFLLSG
jgi:hypothetical protein